MSYVFQIISVERVIEYTNLKQKAPWEYQFHPPPGWPQNGWITFERINFTYSLDGPPVLVDLSPDVKSGEKVCLSHLPL